MITAFLDTNILASGFASFKHPGRAPAQILHAWRAGLFELVISEDILIELEETLHDPYFQRKLSKEDIAELIALLREECAVISKSAVIHGVATHPEDDLILGAAISAKVDYFVTGDKPMIRKVGSSYQGVNLVAPNDFLKILQE